MTEILCRWLNEDVKLSKDITPETFAQDFANGYLLGEILYKHGLQDDFDQFSQNKNSNSKLNNFMRVQPTINLLDIAFNTNIAREIMQEKHSSITQLLYQMYIALTNKEKRNLTGAAIETMRPAAPVRLEQFETKIYKKNLKAKTPRQTDLNLIMLRARYDKFKVEQEQIAFENKFKEEEELRNEQLNKRAYLLNKSKDFREQQAELFARIKTHIVDDDFNFTLGEILKNNKEDELTKAYNKLKSAAVVQIPKTPPKFKKEAIMERQRLFEKNEGEKALKEIESFEKRFKAKNREQHESDLTIVDLEETRGYDDANDAQNQLDPINLIKPESNDSYISKIRYRLQEDAHARKEREKRRRKVLVDQLKANEALEESKREEALVAHLLRQSQFERRIAVELLHARHEKDVIRENVIAREQDVLHRREKEFQDALDKERELARLAKLEYMEQAKKDKEFHDLITAERNEARYKKHYEICYEIVGQIVDLSCKVAEYRELTDDLIPPKLWRDWHNLFRTGKPLYPEEKPLENLKELDKVFNADSAYMDEFTIQLLDDHDFTEYKEMIGEWEPPEKINGDINLENKIVGHIINRLHEMCYPPQPDAPKPVFPPFPLKVVLLGKPFTGKTSALKFIQEIGDIHVLNPQELVTEAIEAYRKNPDLTPIEDKTLNVSQVVSEHNTSHQKEHKESNEINDNDNNDEDPDSKSKKNKAKESVQSVVIQAPAPVENPVQQQSFVFDPVKSDFIVRQLGNEAQKLLNNGEPVRDEIIVQILVEKIKSLDSSKGYIIDGFPSTFEQSKLLEKSLTGHDEDNPVPPRPKQESTLAPNPRPPPSKPKYKSAIDLVVYLDLDNEIALKRSVGRYYGTISHSLYHQQFKPPPEGSHTGLNKVETIEPVKDASNDMEQIQHRITTFEENWSKIKSFYESYSYIMAVGTNEKTNEKNLSEEIQNTLDSYVKLRERRRVEEIERKNMIENMIKQKQKEEEERRNAKKKAEEEAEAEAKRQLEAKKAAELLETQNSPKSSAKNKKGAKGAVSKSPKGRSPEKSQSPKGSKKSSSPKGGKGKKNSKPSTPIQTIQEIAPPKPKTDEPPQPGADDYAYVNDKLDQRMAKIICNHWDIVENSYIDNSKFVFRKIRNEREQIIRYFFTIKSNFKEYLKRPDTKQIEVESFVKDYNSINDDMRDDEEVKAELHQRVEDLKENLWKICDNKKLESERERETIINNGWLQDKTGLLTNDYITLMQAELDRFQDTARMLKDYYKSMQNPMPDELPKEYPRLPLLDLRNPDEYPTETSESQEKSSANETSSVSDGKITPKSPRAKSPRTKSPKSPKSKSPSGSKKATVAAPPPAAAKKGKKTPEPDDNTKKAKIPLIPRRPSSQDGKDAKKTKSKPTAKVTDEVSPVPPEDPNERLIFDAFKTASTYVNSLVATETIALNIEEPPKDAGAGDDKNKTGKASKAAKSRSPSAKKKAESPKSKSPKGKKGGKSAKEDPAPPSVVELSDEDKAKKYAKDKLKREYLAALKKEENSFKVRMELIKMIAVKVINELKLRGDNTYKEMNDKIGDRFIREMDSIKHLCNYIKYCIENKHKIKRELILEQDEFLIDEEIIILRTPSPPPRPDPVEQMAVEYFTIESLRKMFNQFKLVAPEGLVAVKTFSDIFNDLILLNYGTEILPEQWSNLSPNQVDALAKMLAAGSEFVDWRNWLLAASMPWPYPTQTQLLNLLENYKQIDRMNNGYISKSTFLQIPLWFKLDKPPTPIERTQPHSFDRHMHLINFWFELFSSSAPTLPNLLLGEASTTNSSSQNEDRLYYKNMLLYMAAVSDPYDGFLRALSVSQEAPMPRIEPKIQMKAPTFNTPEYEQLKLVSVNTEKFPSDQLVSIDAIHRVFHHGERQRGDTHRFAQSEDPEDFMSLQRITTIFTEINEEPNPVAPYSKLIAHPVLCEMISICTKFRSPDFRTVFAIQAQDDSDTVAHDRRSPD